MQPESIAKLKRRLALACRICFMEGLREEFGHEFSGHISVKVSDNRVLIPGHLHHFGKGLGDVKAADIITVDLKGKVVDGKHEPMDEVYIHTSIYRARPEITSVAHLHCPAATALASTDATILPLSLKSCYFVQGIPVLEPGPRLIDDEEFAAEMVEKLGKRNVVIHRGHGIVTAGKNLEEACLLALYLEGAARFQILASQLGSKLIPFDTKAAIDFARKRDLAKSVESWRYFENKWRHIKV